MVSVSSHPSDDNIRLDSWKEIGQFLRKSTRTVQRWEKTEGLPVHRLAHNERASVFAYSSEVEAWWLSRRVQLEHETDLPASLEDPQFFPPRHARLLPLAVVGALAAIAALCAGGCLLWLRLRAPAADAMGAPSRYLAYATSESGRLVKVPVGRGPAVVAVTPDGAVVIVGNSIDKTLSVIQARRRVVVATIQLGAEPMTLAAAPDGRTVYAGTPLNEITAIDTITGSARKWRTSGPVNDLAITPDGQRLYAAMTYEGLSRIDTASGVETRLLTAPCPVSLAVGPRGDRLYISYQCGGPGGSYGRDAIEVIDLKTEQHTSTINNLFRVGGGLAVSPDGQQLWASALDACTNPSYGGKSCPGTPAGIYHVLRTSDGSLLQTVAVSNPAGSGTPFLSPDGSRAFLVGGDVRVIDTATFKELETMPLRAGARAAFSPDGLHAYVPLPSENALAILDTLPKRCEASSLSMVSFWPGDGNASDVRGGSPGMLKAGAGFAPGLIGQAFSFDGKSGYVDFGRRNDNYPSQGDGSLSLWLKLAASGREMAVVDRMSANGDQGWLLATDARDRIHFCLPATAGRSGCWEANASAGKSRAALSVGTWHHVAVTHSGCTQRLYLDGALQSEWSSCALPIFLEPHLTMLLGSDRTPGHFLNGLVDEFVIYHRALSPNEIRAVYKSNSGACPLL